MSWVEVGSAAAAGGALSEVSICRREVSDDVCNNYMAVYRHISLSVLCSRHKRSALGIECTEAPRKWPDHLHRRQECSTCPSWGWSYGSEWRHLVGGRVKLSG